MNDKNAFSVISSIQIDLYHLRAISQLTKALYTALEKGDDDPEAFFPGVYEIHKQLDDLADQIDAECSSYFAGLSDSSDSERDAV